jgi:hypothetical protein
MTNCGTTNAVFFSVFFCSFLLTASAQPTTNTANPIGILFAAGDITGCTKSKRHDDKTAAILRREVDAAKAAGIPSKILVLGDLAYDSGSEESFSCFAQHWGSGEFYDLLLPVLGNHDQETKGGGAWFKFFQKNETVSSKNSGTGYYDLKFPDKNNGPWHLIALNAYTGFGPKSPQIRWLHKTLERSDAPCVLGFAHPFILSSGYHGHGSKTKAKNGKAAAKAPTVQIKSAVAFFGELFHHGATAYLAGHDHHFEQFRHHDVAGNASDAGVRSFVTGTGGHPLYAEKYDTKAKGQEYYSDSTFGVLKIELYPNNYRWRFLPVEGQLEPVLDPSSDMCTPRKTHANVN